MDNIDYFDISKMAHGALIEQFDAEFEKVLENISDPNTSNKARTIQITFKVKPNKKRNSASIDFQTKSTLAPADPLTTEIFIGKDSNGRLVAEEYTGGIPGQMSIDDIETDNDKVTMLNKSVK
ncbi:replication terminator protein [Vallitalea guaymasensis]|uniref:replication terminator protein n=1 Tax=Vallitalea guaymasensis TaxID=1185412 RepID=UPI000DE4EE33|nr:replication terminator protein [Vallitalea guaymasensis]